MAEIEEVTLEKVVHKELMIVPSSSKNKDEVIHELGRLLFVEGYIENEKEFVDDVYLRETEGVTGIGQGIAIPHGKSDAVKETTIAIAVLENEIEWETLDGKPVKVVIMFAVTDEDSNMTHILLLQEVAKHLAHEDFIEKVVKVKSKVELFKLFTEKIN